MMTEDDVIMVNRNLNLSVKILNNTVYYNIGLVIIIFICENFDIFIFDIRTGNVFYDDRDQMTIYIT